MPRLSTVVLLSLVALSPVAVLAQAPARQLTLQEAIAIAQENGHQARAANAARDAAQFRNRAFHSRRLPQLSLVGTIPSYNRSIIEVQQPDGTSLFRPRDQTNANVSLRLSQQLPVIGGDLFISSSLARVNVSGSQAFETWSSTPFQIGITQPLFRPNDAAWDLRVEDLQVEGAERSWLESREELAISVTGLFFDVYSAKAGLANAINNAAVNDTLYRLNEGRYQVGKIGENDLLQSELALLRAQNAADAARLQYDRALAALRLGLNLPADAVIEPVLSAAIPDVQVDTAVAASAALMNRAAVTDARLAEVQAERSVTTARLANGPGATIQASYGYNATGDAFNNAYHGLQEARQFSLGVQMPLWQWGAHREGVEAARADRERVSALNEVSLEQVRQDAHFAALELEQARRSLLISAKADTVAGKRFEVAYNRYVIGRIDIDNLYQAQSEKDQALVAYGNALRSYWQAYYRLRRLTLYDFVAGRSIE
jgi:outer membrane protein TolC